MQNATHLADSAPVVRASRIELVDHEGNARMVLGHLGGDGTSWNERFYGLELRRPDGSVIATFHTFDSSATLEFDHSGGFELTMGTDDQHGPALIAKDFRIA